MQWVGKRPLAAAFAAMSLWLPAAANAAVTQFSVISTDRPALDGRSFGAYGTAEKITARATIAVDPNDPHNAVIADIGLAPRNAQGLVEATAEVVILRPTGGGNGTLLLELPNRGRKLMPMLFDDALEAPAQRLEHAGDVGLGFLLSQGYTLAWVGWQGDLPAGPNVMRVQAPVVPNVTGVSREEFVFDHTRNPVTVALTYPAATTPGDAVLTVRAHTDDARQRPADLSFRFTDASHIEITRPAGFDAGAIYELVYTARDPMVLGLGFAAVRDVASFLRQETAANPLGRPVQRAYAHGISQSGRALRDFLYWGFNEDEHGRMVFEAMNPHIAGTRRSFTNARFAQPGRNPSSHADRLYPADQFPFTYAVMDDPVSGRRDGLLLRCRLTNTCPKIFQTDSNYEFFGARASLLVTDTQGNHIDLPAEVRAYMTAGAPHFSGPDALMTKVATCALPLNPIHAGAPMRALLVALDGWVRDGIEPPSSRYPMRSDNTLVPVTEPFPAIPGLPHVGIYNPAYLVDYSTTPPAVMGWYPVFLPRVDGDGMTVAGVHIPAIEAPRATYLGWNPRAEGFAAGALCTNMGSTVPFATTRAERDAAHDPRPSLEERYATQAAYVAVVRASTERLMAERLMLPADADASIRAAEADTLAKLRR